MARGLSSSVKTELATGVIDPVLLIEIGFSTPIYLKFGGKYGGNMMYFYLSRQTDEQI